MSNCFCCRERRWERDSFCLLFFFSLIYRTFPTSRGRSRTRYRRKAGPHLPHLFPVLPLSGRYELPLTCRFHNVISVKTIFYLYFSRAGHVLNTRQHALSLRHLLPRRLPQKQRTCGVSEKRRRRGTVPAPPPSSGTKTPTPDVWRNQPLSQLQPGHKVFNGPRNTNAMERSLAVKENVKYIQDVY